MAKIPKKVVHLQFIKETKIKIMSVAIVEVPFQADLLQQIDPYMNGKYTKKTMAVAEEVR